MIERASIPPDGQRTARRSRIRRARVYESGRLAGLLEEIESGYRFTYDPRFLADPRTRSVSVTLPKRSEPYDSPHLFSFFHGLLSEGALKDLQCRILKVDEQDYFGRLIQTAGGDTIGSVTVVPDDGP